MNKFPNWTIVNKLVDNNYQNEVIKSFAISYYFFLSSSDNHKWYLTELKRLLIQIISLLKNKRKTHSLPQIIINLTANKSFLQNLTPVILELELKKANYQIWAPYADLDKLKVALDPVIYTKIVALEQVFAVGRIKVIFLIGKSIFSTLRHLSIYKRNKFKLFPSLLRHELINQLFLIALDKQLANHSLSLLQCNDHWLWEYQLCRFVSALEGSSYNLQHGVLGDYQYPFYSNKFLCWTKSDIDQMEGYGAQLSNLILSGSPYLDSIYINQTKVKYWSKVMVFLAQPFYKTFAAITQDYFSTINYLSILSNSIGFQLVIKLHPLDEFEQYPKQLQQYLSIEPLSSYIGQGHLFISLDSTALLDCAAQAETCIQYIPDELQAFLYDLSHVTSVLRTKESLQKMIDEMMTQQINENVDIIPNTSKLGESLGNLGTSDQVIAHLLMN